MTKTDKFDTNTGILGLEVASKKIKNKNYKPKLTDDTKLLNSF